MTAIGECKAWCESRFLGVLKPGAEPTVTGNVVGVGIGPKLVRSLPTEEIAVRIYVRNKVHPLFLRPEESIPTEFEGVPTDVVETGEFSVWQPIPPIYHRKVRPAMGGLSVGHYEVTAGTFGCLVRARDGTELILSNNHVLANENRGAEGDPILQPGGFDGGRTDRDVIGRLQAWVPVRHEEENLVDAAVAQPYADTDVTADILGLGRLSGSDEPRLGMSVRKSGRTTRVTQGTITDVNVTVRVGYTGGSFVFTDQVFIAGDRGPFSAGGDSGSVIVSEDRKAVGLLFAGSRSVTVANKMPQVERALGVAPI